MSDPLIDPLIDPLLTASGGAATRWLARVISAVSDNFMDPNLTCSLSSPFSLVPRRKSSLSPKEKTYEFSLFFDK
jgi:hypothetical protein